MRISGWSQDVCSSELPLRHAPHTVDDAQLEIMHATEGNYHYARRDGIDLVFEDGRKADSVERYVGRHGNLLHAGSAIALAAVAAEGRSLPAMTTAEVLLLVRDRIAPDAEINAFILRLIGDEIGRAHV